MYLSHLDEVNFSALYIETFKCIYTKIARRILEKIRIEVEEHWKKIRIKELMYFKNT